MKSVVGDIQVEKDVYSKIDRICGQPNRQSIIFYKQKGEHWDQTLGLFLEKFVFDLAQHCPTCDKPLACHSLELYHGEGCLAITPRRVVGFHDQATNS